MKIRIFDTKTFASHLFSGNPAKVCILPDWLDNQILHNIAMENNLSEVVFIRANGNGYDIRWFNRKGEENLCGHGTLAAAHIIDKILSKQPGQPIHFNTHFHGELVALPVEHNCYQLCLPRLDCEKVSPRPTFLEGISTKPKNVYKSLDYLLEYASTEDVRLAQINYDIVQNIDARGIILSAADAEVDCISRCFYPGLTVKEDVVTGSAHCIIAPFWSDILGKKEIIAQQYSRELNRSGLIQCKLYRDRVRLTGKVIIYLEGIIHIPEYI